MLEPWDGQGDQLILLIWSKDRVLPLLVQTSSALTHSQRSLGVVISIWLLLLQHGAKVQALNSLVSKKPEWQDTRCILFLNHTRHE